MEGKVRLQKYLADSGVASRRKAESFIIKGQVKVNGKVVTKLGTKVGVNDKIELNNKIVRACQEKVYIMLNKPAGYLSTAKKSKEKGKIVLDLVKTGQRLFSAGRLDRDSSGLLILTNDGDLALKLTHPKFEKEKEYEVEVDKNLTNNIIIQLRKGVIIDKYKTLPAKVKQFGVKKFNIIIKEGKNRQIRKMCESLGYKVKKLHRTRINKLCLGNLKSGKWRKLKKQELQLLK